MNKFKEPAVYGLHAGDGLIRYVGATSVNSQNRLWQHNYRANAGHPGPVYAWMRSVGASNVQVVDLEKVEDASRLFEIEAAWIAKMLDAGCDLVNQIARDGILNSMSEASRVRIGAANAGRETWIKGKRGAEAGWTPERRAAQSERAATKRANRVPRHGTATEYRNHGCRCDDCKAATLNPRQPVAEHGRYMYKRDKCRCEICVSANRAYLREWNAQKRNQLAA